MKILKCISVFLIVLFPLFSIAQIKLGLTSIEQNILFKNIQGQYARVDVKMGTVRGTGGVTLGNILPINNFSFNIYVLSKQDKQFGVMKFAEIETKNYDDYLIRIPWENNVKNQGTINGEIQILYASRKDKIEAYFVSGTTFSIFWWLELTESNKKAINELISRKIEKSIAYQKYNLELKKQIDYISGKWQISVNNTPNGNVKLTTRFEYIDGILKGYYIDPTSKEEKSMTKVSINDGIFFLNFNIEGFDITISLKRNDENNVTGRMMDMFEVIGIRVN